MGDMRYGEGTQLLWFSLSLQDLLWSEVLGDILLEEKEGASSVLGVLFREAFAGFQGGCLASSEGLGLPLLVH